jgi:long-chain fatty acid transport protein
MSKGHKGFIFISLVTAAMFLVSNDYAYAGNATRMLGFSSRDAAMAGATTASAEDTSCLVRNPAGLVRIGNRVDVEYENIIPHDVTMRTEGIAVPPLPFSLSNNAGGFGKMQTSTVTYLPGGNIGVSYRIPGTDKYPVSVGVGAFTMAGVATSYPSSRLNPLLETFLGMGSGVYDRMVDLRSMRIAPGMAVAFNDNLSFGATANIGIQAINADLAFSEGAPTVVGSAFREQEDSGKWDFAPGGGFTLGLLYKFNDMLSVGTSYESQTWMGGHYKYKNTLPHIDEPPIVNAGLSIKPIKELEFTFDTRYINWTSVPIAGKKPIHGGFGWQDQWVFATGAECSLFNEKLKLRVGYNYGKSPIQRRFVFANALLPLVVENHFTTGFSYFVTKNLSLDFVWEHHFFNAMADNGEGDIYSRNGVGTKVTAAGEVIGVGLGYKFN